MSIRVTIPRWLKGTTSTMRKQLVSYYSMTDLQWICQSRTINLLPYLSNDLTHIYHRQPSKLDWNQLPEHWHISCQCYVNTSGKCNNRWWNKILCRPPTGLNRGRFQIPFQFQSNTDFVNSMSIPDQYINYLPIYYQDLKELVLHRLSFLTDVNPSESNPNISQCKWQM